ncbi:MAG: hypothetical protein CSB49_05690 [Proteobacteria bacterium]|nr:MAG: hypothetical protein CSB49_05690 [Pseudomonadota bacterium]
MSSARARQLSTQLGPDCVGKLLARTERGDAIRAKIAERKRSHRGATARLSDKEVGLKGWSRREG